MKGVVFTEFIEHVAQSFGEDAVDDLIEASDLPSGGAYTSVGTYDPEEMNTLCSTLSAQTGESPDKLVRGFGYHLGCTFAREHAAYYERAANLFDFLDSVHGHIHVEVRKLYPDAELPLLNVRSRGERELVLEYCSPRRMGLLAEGLIHSAATRFGVKVDVQRLPWPERGDDGAVFVVNLLEATVRA